MYIYIYIYHLGVVFCPFRSNLKILKPWGMSMATTMDIYKTNDNQNMSQQVHRGESERRKHDASSATGNTARGWNNWRRSWLAVLK